jgi:hypothetical protein
MVTASLDVQRNEIHAKSLVLPLEQVLVNLSRVNPKTS